MRSMQRPVRISQENHEEEGLTQFPLFTLLKLFTLFSLLATASVGDARRVFVEANILCKFVHGTLLVTSTIRGINGRQF
jgi:hypothetical protein